MSIKRCPPKKPKLNPGEIVKDLSGYIRVSNINELEEWDRIKYLRRETLEYKKGGWVVKIDIKNKYLVVEGFSQNWKTCKNVRFSINWEEVIVFKKDKCE